MELIFVGAEGDIHRRPQSRDRHIIAVSIEVEMETSSLPTLVAKQFGKMEWRQFRYSCITWIKRRTARLKGKTVLDFCGGRN
ncbi:hypothetical protein KCP78_20495 [Salmonella enterica subsp. enterica]|nr:hypothetical protein KCP78_20495 [Salmonella enterica subsp. enterica]